MKMWHGVKVGLACVLRFCERVCWAVMLGWVAVMTIGTIMRYIFKKPMIFQVEVVSLGLVIFAAFSFAPVFAHREHIRVDMLTRHLPARYQKMLVIITECIFVLFCLIIIYSTFELVTHAIEVGSRSEISDIPLLPFILCIPIGFAVLIVTLIVDLCEHLRAYLINAETDHSGER